MTRRVIARTHARVSRSFMSTVDRSFTAVASVPRTLADRTSYCWAPANAAGAKAKSAAPARRRRLAARRGLRMREPRLHMLRGFADRDLRHGRIAAMLVLDHAFLQAALADHDAVRDADELLVGEQHAGALVTVVEEHLDAGAGDLGVQHLRGGLHRFALAIAERDDGHREGRHGVGPDDSLVVVVLLDGRGDDARDADAVAAHLHGLRLALLVDVIHAHLRRVRGAQLEHVSHFDAARA